MSIAVPGRLIAEATVYGMLDPALRNSFARLRQVPDQEMHACAQALLHIRFDNPPAAVACSACISAPMAVDTTPTTIRHRDQQLNQ